MADQNQTPPAWEPIKPWWQTNIDPTLEAQGYRQQWNSLFGDKARARRQGNYFFQPTPNGTYMMRPTPGHDRYTRITATSDLGGTHEIEVPGAALMREGDKLPNDPAAPYYGTGYKPPRQWTVGDASLDAELYRAAVADRFNRTQEPNSDQQAHFQAYQKGHELLGDMAARLPYINQSAISRMGQLGIDWYNMSGDEMIKAGVDKNVAHFLDDVRQLKESPFMQQAAAKAPGAPETGAVTGPLGELLAATKGGIWGLAAGVGVATAGKVGEGIWNYVANKDNLNNLRRTIPQDLNKVDQQFYNYVKNTPDVRWHGDQYDYINNNIAAHPGMSQNDNPYREGVGQVLDYGSNPPPNAAHPIIPLGAGPQRPPEQPPGPQQPGQPPEQPGQQPPGQPPAAPVAAPIRPDQPVTAQGAVAPAASGAAPAAQNVPLGQRLLQTLGHFFTFSLGQHGQPTAAAPATAQTTQPAQQPGQPQPQYYQNFGYGSGYPQPSQTPRAAPVATPAARTPSAPPRPRQAAAPVVRRAQAAPGSRTPVEASWGQVPYVPSASNQEEGGIPIWGTSTTMAAPVGRPGEDVEVGAPIGEASALTQAHVDQMEPGRTFVWHDGNTYVKT